MAYTTLANVRAELKVTATTDDALISGYIATAQRIIEAPAPLGTGRVFEAAADTTRTLDAPTEASADPDGPSYLLLLTPAGDLCQITSVVNGDGTTVSAGDYVTLPAARTPYYGLRLKRNAGLLWTYDDSPEGAIAITGRWAYSVTAPADIVRAATRLAVWMYRSQASAGADDRAVRTEQGIILPAKIPDDIRMTIESYRSVLGT